MVAAGLETTCIPVTAVHYARMCNTRTHPSVCYACALDAHNVRSISVHTCYGMRCLYLFVYVRMVHSTCLCRLRTRINVNRACAVDIMHIY